MIRSHFLDAEAEFIGLLADMSDSESKEIGLMKSVNGIQLMSRMGSAESAMKRVRMAAFEEEPEEKMKAKPQKESGSKSLR